MILIEEEFNLNVSPKIKQSLVMLLAAVTLTTGVTSYAALTREKELVFVYNDQEENIQTKATTVEEVLDEQGYRLTDRASLNHPLDAEISDAMRIEMKADKTITFNYQNAELTIDTNAETVAAFLEEQQYTLNENETVFPALDTELKDGTAIHIQRMDTVVESSEKEIEFETEYRTTDDLYVDESRVVQDGENGIETTQVTTKTYNGSQLNQTTDVFISKEPVPKIIEEGTKEYPVEETESATEAYTGSTESYSAPATESYEEPQSSSNAGGWMNFTATAYDPTVGDTTRMGTPARVGVIAVDPNVIPLGSTVEVEGYGVFSAEDTGGAIKGNKIDIFVSTHSEAIQFGVRSVRVRVLH